ncbi:MAG TPA: hypothetical protein VNN10_09410, partial [Dehalococcoidia bacterium]|nr:hypothetical protein [Dehalococcoidia bacterium]
EPPGASSGEPALIGRWTTLAGARPVPAADRGPRRSAPLDQPDAVARGGELEGAAECRQPERVAAVGCTAGA